MLASPWSAASLYFSDCFQKHIFSMVLFSHFGAGGERHGFIRRVLFESLRVMHNDFLIFIALIRQIDEICYRSATNGNFKRNICHTKFNIVLPILLHCLYKYQLTKRETMYLDTTLICLSSLLLFARSNSCKSVMLEKLLPIIETI